MSGPIPYLGSKISLVSISEIRYEGILYTIDAQESIIALAKVRSFGTEDRPTEMPVPAKDEVYEYIIFRGTDIKKIEVCDTPKQPTLPGGLHNDPAIVQHSAPSVPTSFQAAPFSRQSLGPIGGSLGLSYGAYGQSMTQQGIPGTWGFPVGSTSQPSELNNVGSSGGGGGGGGGSVGNLDPQSGSVAVPGPIGQPPQSDTHAHQTGSRSSTPTARKSPVYDNRVQMSPLSPRDEKKSPQQQQQQQQQQERPQRNSSQNQARRSSQQSQQQMGQQGRQQQQSSSQQHPSSHQQPAPQQNHTQHHYNSNQYYQYQQYQGRGGNMGRARGRGRPAGQRGRPSGQRGRGQAFNQGNRQRQFQDRQLFEKDYDFEQANEEFEELRNQLAKTKISEAGDKKDDSGHETTDDVDESLTCYDKTKSFFDSISCEAIERSKGKSQRPDWRLERKINVETFGVSSARRGYYPRSHDGYYRGYYRNYNYNQGYYRGGGGFRGGRGGGGGNRGAANINGVSQRGGAAGAAAAAAAAGAGSSYASAVRNSTPTK